MNDLGDLWEDNNGYRWIARRAQLAGARWYLLTQGTTKFGPPDKEVRARLGAISDMAQLQEIGDRIFTAPSCAEMLDPPR